MIKFKEGAAYLKSAFITLFICILIMLIMTFWSAVANIQSFKSSARTVLDAYVSEKSIKIFDEIKDSKDNIISFSADDYNQRLVSFCGFTDSGGHFEKLNPDLIYSVSIPSLTVDNSELNMKMECTVTVPLYFCGVQISNAVAPISINSSFEDIF